MKPRSTGPRRASVERRFEPGQSDFPVIAGRALPQFWSLFSPHFRGVFLPPQWRAEGNGIAWSWREPATNPPISAAELATLRKRLAGAQRSFAATAADAPSTSDPRAPAATLAPLAKCLGELIATLLALPDPAFAASTARTEAGLVLHSWGLRSPLTPFYPDAADREISGTVFIAKQAAPDLAVLLETPEGQPISRTSSDANGRFRFLQLTPGYYRVRADSPVTPFPPEGLATETQRASVTGLELHDLAHRLHATKRSLPQLSAHRRKLVVISLVALALGGLALHWTGLNSAPVHGSITSSTATSFAPDTLAKDFGRESLPPLPRSVEPLSREPAPARREVAREPTAIAPPSHAIPFRAPALPAPFDQRSPSATASEPSSGPSVLRGSLSSTPTAAPDNSAPPSASSSPPSPSETLSDSSRSSPSPAATSGNPPSIQNPNSTPPPSPPASHPPSPPTKSPAPDPKPTPSSSAATPPRQTDSPSPEPPTAPTSDPFQKSHKILPLEKPPAPDSNKPDSSDVESPASKTASAIPRPAASADSASPPESTPHTRPPSEPVPPDPVHPTSTELTSINSDSPSTAPRLQHLQLRLAPWRLRLLHDAILPTHPTRVGTLPAESLSALRTRLYREHQKKIPAAFLAPITRRGFALELPPTSPPVTWNMSANSTAITASATATRAEFSWTDAQPPPPFSSFALTSSTGEILARIAFDADRESSFTFVAPLRGWPWLELSSSPTDQPASNLTWQVLTGPEAPASWQFQSHRLDLIAPETTSGRHQRTVALVDQVTGWALITELTQTTEQ